MCDRQTKDRQISKVPTPTGQDARFAILVNRETEIFYPTLDDAKIAARIIKEKNPFASVIVFERLSGECIPLD